MAPAPLRDEIIWQKQGNTFPLGHQGYDLRWAVPIVERRVRSDRVVIPSPSLDDDLYFFQAVEDFAVQ